MTAAVVSAVAQERLNHIESLYEQEDGDRAALDKKLRELGVDVPEPYKLPIEKLYFTGEMLSQYEPCSEALQSLLDTDGEDDDAWKAFEEHMVKFMDFSWRSTWNGKRYDLVMYGVSGYTGYLMMEYIKRVGLKKTPEKFTFAWAGRTPSKVKALRDKEFEGTQWADAPVLEASYDNPISMIDLAKSARAIVNVAGPYMLTPGEILVDACCWTRTHYMDINGEIPWFFRTLSLHKRAVEAKTCIIPAAAVAGGYPDLLMYHNCKKLREKLGKEAVGGKVYSTGGGMGAGTGGGTLATRNAMSSAGDEVRKLMADPFALGGFIPDRDRNGLKEVTIKQGTGDWNYKIKKNDADAALSKMQYDQEAQLFGAPHTYAYFDTRICRRSNALLADHCGWCYGRNFNFQEFLLIGGELEEAGKKAIAEGRNPQQAIDAAMGGIMASMGGVAGEKKALQEQGKYYKQGEGPPLEGLADAWTAFFAYCTTEDKEVERASLCGRDGYFETARVACETAFTCIFDYDKVAIQGGILTATACCAEPLLKRLVQSGLNFHGDDYMKAEELKPPEGSW